MKTVVVVLVRTLIADHPESLDDSGLVEAIGPMSRARSTAAPHPGDRSPGYQPLQLLEVRPSAGRRNCLAATPIRRKSAETVAILGEWGLGNGRPLRRVG